MHANLTNLSNSMIKNEEISTILSQLTLIVESQCYIVYEKVNLKLKEGINCLQLINDTLYNI